METLIHADIFFFISTIALVIISIGLIVVLVYVIKIVKNISDVSDKVKDESTEILNDIKGLRGSIKQEGFKLLNLGGFFGKLFKRRSSRKKE